VSEHLAEIPDLSGLPAGYSVVLECLAQQQQQPAAPRPKFKRILGLFVVVAIGLPANGCHRPVLP